LRSARGWVHSPDGRAPTRSLHRSKGTALARLSTRARACSGRALLGVVVRRRVDRDDEEQDTEADRRESATAGLSLGGEEEEAASADQQDATDEEGEKVHP
jgi:hypothetical protein